MGQWAGRLAVQKIPLGSSSPSMGPRDGGPLTSWGELAGARPAALSPKCGKPPAVCFAAVLFPGAGRAPRINPSWGGGHPPLFFPPTRLPAQPRRCAGTLTPSCLQPWCQLPSLPSFLPPLGGKLRPSVERALQIFQVGHGIEEVLGHSHAPQRCEKRLGREAWPPRGEGGGGGGRPSASNPLLQMFRLSTGACATPCNPPHFLVCGLRPHHKLEVVGGLFPLWSAGQLAGATQGGWSASVCSELGEA